MLNEIVYSGRHYFLFIIVCSQDCKGLPPAVRQNADLIAITYQTQDRSIETITKDYADIFTDKEIFKEIIKANTQDHQLLIIDQTEAHYNIDEVFFVDKAPDPENNPDLIFRIGDTQFWKESKCDWEEQLQMYDNKPKISREEYDRICRKLAEEDKKKYENRNFYRHFYTTSHIQMAPLEERLKYYAKIRKDMRPSASEVAYGIAFDRNRWRYIPDNRFKSKYS